MLAVKTVFTVPARAVYKGHPNPVADRNARDICANRFDCARASMARNARQLRQGWSGEITSMGVDIAVTDTAGLDFDENFPRSRFWDGDLFYHKRLPDRFYDGSFHPVLLSSGTHAGRRVEFPKALVNNDSSGANEQPFFSF
jgi:hypothetical protein